MKGLKFRNLTVLMTILMIIFIVVGVLTVVRNTINGPGPVDSSVKAPIPQVNILNSLFSSEDNSSTTVETLEEKTSENVVEESSDVLDDKETAEIIENAIPVKEKPVTIKLGHGSVQINMVNENKSLCKATAVDAYELAYYILSDEELAMVHAGTKVQMHVRLVALFESAVSREDVEQFNSCISTMRETMPNLKKATYFDISIVEKIGHDDWKNVSEIQGPITLSVKIPEHAQGHAKEYYILGVDDDGVRTLEDLDKDENTITAPISVSSIYAIVYDEEEEPVEEVKVVHNDNGWYKYLDSIGWFTAAGILILALIRSRIKSVLKK